MLRQQRLQDLCRRQVLPYHRLKHTEKAVSQRHPTYRAYDSLQKFYSIGVSGNETPYCRFYTGINTANHIEFLTGVHKRYDKFLLLPDNVVYRKSKALKGSLQRWAPRSRLCIFCHIHWKLSVSKCRSDAQVRAHYGEE